MDDDDLAKVKEEAAPSLLEIALRKLRAFEPKILAVIDSGPVLLVFMLMTFWALFANEVRTCMAHVHGARAWRMCTARVHVHSAWA